MSFFVTVEVWGWLQCHPGLWICVVSGPEIMYVLKCMIHIKLMTKTQCFTVSHHSFTPFRSFVQKKKRRKVGIIWYIIDIMMSWSCHHYLKCSNGDIIMSVTLHSNCVKRLKCTVHNSSLEFFFFFYKYKTVSGRNEETIKCVFYLSITFFFL